MHLFKKKPGQAETGKKWTKPVTAETTEKPVHTEQKPRPKYKPKEFNSEKYLQRLKKQHRHGLSESKYALGKIGLIGSLYTISQGTAKVCAGIAANPVLIGGGLILGVISLGYIIWKYFS